MSEDVVRLPPDSTGKKIRAIKKTVGENEVYMEGTVVYDEDGIGLFSADGEGRKALREQLPFYRYGGRVTFTFDDGTVDHYNTVFPLFETYGIKATFYVDQRINTGGFLTSAQILEMSDAGHEIGCHYANPATGKTAIEAITGKSCTTYAYVGGHYTELILRTIRGLFDYGRTIDTGMNCKFTIPTNPHTLLSVGTSTDDIVTQVRQGIMLARLTGAWVIINFHIVDAENCTATHLEEMISFATGIDANVTTVSQGPTEAVEPIVHWRTTVITTKRVIYNTEGPTHGDLDIKGIHKIEDLTIFIFKDSGTVLASEVGVGIMSDGRWITSFGATPYHTVGNLSLFQGYINSEDGSPPYPLPPLGMEVVRKNDTTEKYAIRVNIPIESYSATKIRVHNLAGAGDKMTAYILYRLKRPIAQIGTLDRLTI